MTFRLILAICFGFGVGCPFGIWAACKAAERVVRRQIGTLVDYEVHLDAQGIPESISLELPKDLERRMEEQ